MPAFFSTTTLTAITTYPTTPQIDLTKDPHKFVPDSFHITNFGADDNVFYSFDGTNNHGRVAFSTDHGLVNLGDRVRNKSQRLWLKREGLTGAAITADVQAVTDL